MSFRPVGLLSEKQSQENEMFYVQKCVHILLLVFGKCTKYILLDGDCIIHVR